MSHFTEHRCASVIVALPVCHRKPWRSGISVSGNPSAQVPSTQSTKFGDNQYANKCQ